MKIIILAVIIWAAFYFAGESKKRNAETEIQANQEQLKRQAEFERQIKESDFANKYKAIKRGTYEKEYGNLGEPSLSFPNLANESAKVYKSQSGASYKYNLNDPVDAMKYKMDQSAQLKDEMTSDIRMDMDRSYGQAGGGIIDQ